MAIEFIQARQKLQKLSTVVHRGVSKTKILVCACTKYTQNTFSEPPFTIKSILYRRTLKMFTNSTVRCSF